MFKDLVDSVTDVGAFTSSVKDFFVNISVSSVVMTIIAIFLVIGLIDKIRGNKRGYGAEFDKGFEAMGPLAFSVVGIVALSPVLYVVLGPLITPVYKLIGASPAMFPSSILALDMGGYPLAKQLAAGNEAIANYSGLIVASMMGITVCFTIPYALNVIKKEDRNILALGILIGLITLPIGCILGGLTMNMTSTPLAFKDLMLNTLPVVLLAVIIAVGIILKQNLMMKIFTVFGKVMTFIILVSLGIAVFQYLTGIRIPLLNKMVEEDPVLGGVPLEIGLLLVGLIAIVLLGAFPMIKFLNKVLGKAINKIGSKIGLTSQASTGLLTQLASSIPVLSVINDMDKKGKLYNLAFAVSGSFVLGDVLAFVGGTNPEMIFPVIVANLSGGILAITLAYLLLRFNVIKLDKDAVVAESASAAEGMATDVPQEENPSDMPREEEKEPPSENAEAV